MHRFIIAWIALTAAACAQAIDLRRTEVLSGLGGMTDVVNAADGSNVLYIATQGGTVRVFAHGSLRSEPFLNIADRISNGDEQGLLSIAFPPGYAGKRYFYAYYTDRNGDSVLSRFRVSADGFAADAGSEQIVLAFDQPYPNHNGGKLEFGLDGYLYLSTGDGGSGDDPQNRAQNLGTLLGKLLRLDTEHGASTYTIPSDNPFRGQANARAEIWAYGLRNPWRIAFDRPSGDLYIADVGQNSREEIDFQPAASRGGENYGWRIFEGSPCHIGCPPVAGFTFPVAEYDHVGGSCAVIGGYVYRGTAYPNLVGTYFYGDLCSGRIWGLARNGGTWTATALMNSGLQISTFGRDEVGNVYVADGASGILYLLSDGAPVVTHMPITAGFTGTWYDPTQSGHGVFVEVLPDGRVVGSWFTFRPEGGQAWIIGIGAIDNDRVVLYAVIPQGTRFIPNFNAAEVTRPAWGTMTLTFDSCTSGSLAYNSVVGFGSGVMPLTRLTAVAGSSCP